MGWVLVTMVDVDVAVVVDGVPDTGVAPEALLMDPITVTVLDILTDRHLIMTQKVLTVPTVLTVPEAPMTVLPPLMPMVQTLPTWFKNF